MFNAVAITLALSVAASATSPKHILEARDCQDAYKTCIAAGTPEVACGCTLASCSGEDNARTREFCATATANLPRPTPTSIPGGCNPAHPESCPSSYFLTSTKPAVPSTTPCTPLSSTVAPQPSTAPGSYPHPVSGKTWTIANLSRYCGEGNSGCDYNFEVTANGKTERCTVIRMPGSNAATESWSNQACTTGSNLTISWGYATTPAPPFAVITVNSGKELAWFGVPNVNGGRVTASSPFGSGEFGTLPASPVYTN